MEPQTEPTKPGVGKTVMVVDDSTPIRKVLACAFLSGGFKTCIEAENGKEAIEAAKREKPDLVILDLSMPVMNGLQCAPELRKILSPPDTPIILFTIFAQNLSPAEASHAGISLVLDKNTPVLTLVEKAHQLLANSGSTS